MSIKVVCKAIANAWHVVWDWRFLAVANLAASVYCLCYTIMGASPPKTVACNIDNPLMTNVYGIQRMSETAAQTMSAVHSIEHNTPDFTAPLIVVVLTVLWLVKTSFDEYRDGLTVVVTSVLTVLSVIAAGWGFIGGVAASQKLDGAARQITQSFQQINELQYEALKVADAQGESADARKIRACAIALDMMSAERLHYCTSNFNVAGCFLSTTADSEKKAAIEAETRRWLFSE
ncbi:hypothetical protein F0160_37250 [Paraburkholderia sp. JPY303]|uniref:hypothetical protein n=1 Tax=Paraburkholderia atlantica TaxID=2654982 RepID=UPI00159049B4|nr:hypothetical protein [Paraburkholderia atlantica]NUY35957.1 hypothetical protein [Paraburkholderia atlantica]